MAKSLCKWEKTDYRTEEKKLKKLVSRPKHVCRNCGRAARTKKALCNPTPLN